MKKTNQDILYFSWVRGYIDSHDAVHSVQVYFGGDTFAECKTHFDLFGYCSRRWDWTYDNCIRLTDGDNFEEFDGEKIRTHLTKQYGIRWWENGYHDLDHFMSKLTKARFD